MAEWQLPSHCRALLGRTQTCVWRRLRAQCCLSRRCSCWGALPSATTTGRTSRSRRRPAGSSSSSNTHATAQQQHPSSSSTASASAADSAVDGARHWPSKMRNCNSRWVYRAACVAVAGGPGDGYQGRHDGMGASASEPLTLSADARAFVCVRNSCINGTSCIAGGRAAGSCTAAAGALPQVHHSSKCSRCTCRGFCCSSSCQQA